MKKMEEAAQEVPAANGNGKPQANIETVDNHIYFYSGVGGEKTVQLIKSLNELNHQLINEPRTRMPVGKIDQTPIWLHINSGGGDLFDGLAIADQIKMIETPVYSVIEGYAASAATFVSMACDKRFITPLSFMLVHQFTSFVWGTYEEFKDDMVVQNMLMDKIIDFYKRNSNLKRKRIKKLLKHNSWFSAEQALEVGFVDKIIR